MNVNKVVGLSRGARCLNLIRTCSHEAGLAPKRESLTSHLELLSRAPTVSPNTESLSSNEINGTGKRPMVVIFSWLLAKNRPLSKFREYYDEKGYDVLTVKTSPSDLVWPKRAQVVVQDMLEFLSEDKQVDRPLLVHGFSIGGYLYGETLMRTNPGTKFEHVQPRIKGQIMDSPVDVDGVPDGVSRTVFKNSVVGQKAMKGLIHSYMYSTYPFTGRHYNAASRHLHANPVRHAPSLWLYSSADGFVEAEDVKNVIRKWESRGILCLQKCWNNSPHIMHFHYNNEEYVSLLDNFMDLVNGSQ